MLEPTSDTRDWQQSVVVQLGKLADANAATAVILERLSGRLDGMDARIKIQEDAARAATPTTASRAAWSQAWAGWAALIVSVLALLVVIATHIRFQ